MGCVCCSLSTFVSIVLHALERISLCTVCAMLTCCLLFTIMSVLIMGIGIGFHYCEVANAAEAMANAAKQAGSSDDGGDRGGGLAVPDHRRDSGTVSAFKKPLRSVNQAVKRGFAHRLGRRDRGQLMPSNNNTINDIILGNSTDAISTPSSLRRARRDLNVNEQNSVNDTEVTSNENNSVNYTEVTSNENNSVNYTEVTSNENNSVNYTEVTSNENTSVNDTEVTSNENNSVNDTDVTSNENNSVNDTEVTSNENNSVNDTAATNETLIYEYYDDVKLNTTNEMANSDLSHASSDISMRDVKLLRQNCTLLNFFARFLHI